MRPELVSQRRSHSDRDMVSTTAEARRFRISQIEPPQIYVRPEDRPSRTPPSTLTLRGQAARAGAPIGTLCDAIHRRDGELGVRRILGVLALVKKHGAAVVSNACPPWSSVSPTIASSGGTSSDCNYSRYPVAGAVGAAELRRLERP